MTGQEFADQTGALQMFALQVQIVSRENVEKLSLQAQAASQKRPAGVACH